MNYARTKVQLLPLIQEEIARVAGSVRSSDGTSLFDEIIYHSRDDNRIFAFAEQAASQLRVRLSKVDTTGAAVADTIQFIFNVPDMPANLQSVAVQDITNYIVYHATASWLLNKNIQDRGAEYTARAKAEEDKAVGHILTRTFNSRMS